MTLKTAYFIFILSIILTFATSIVSFDITKLLQNHGEFSIFNDLLTQTGIATNINNRQTITVFAVDNSDMGSIQSKPREVAKNILMTHVVLDYYDTKKLANNFANKEGNLTNLFQATGAAVGKQGYLKVSATGNDITVGSLVDNAPQSAKVLKDVVSQPYDISVLQISQPIMTPGIEQISPAGAPKDSSPEAESPKKDHDRKDAKSDANDSESKDDSSSATSPSPTDSASSSDEADNKSAPHNAAATQVTNFGGVVLSATLMGLAALGL